MSMASVCAQIEQVNRRIVRQQTWGHMEAKPGTAHAGSFIFINGQHGDMCVIESRFDSFEEGPNYFEDRAEFIWSKIKDSGPCSATGVYRFEGEYRGYKRQTGERSGFFVGKITRIDLTKHAARPARRTQA